LAAPSAVPLRNLTRKLSLELAASRRSLSFEDADLDSAVEGWFDGIWFNQGPGVLRWFAFAGQESVAEKTYSANCKRA
jgi:acyl-CoA reductase-like NAD-dependent aldehyde dehydrogenase